MAEPVFDLEMRSGSYFSLFVKRLERTNNTKLLLYFQSSKMLVFAGYECEHHWNSNIVEYGHKLQFIIDNDTYIDILDVRHKYEEEIKSIFNQIYNIEDEYIAKVQIIPSDIVPNVENKHNSIFIYTHNKMPNINNDDLLRIWGENNSLKVFISHKDIDKKEATLIQDELKKINISSFVAHQNIEWTEEWIKEILLALQSMDLFLAYINENFFDSIWTNQEVGFALGRNIPVVPIKNKKDPEGFISILQAKQYNDNNEFNSDFISMIMKQKNIHYGIKNKLADCIISAFSCASSWNDAEGISKYFMHIKEISSEQKSKLIDAFNCNSQINECIALSGYDVYGVRRGTGNFCDILNRLTGKDYRIDKICGKITIQEHNIVIPASDDIPF